MRYKTIFAIDSFFLKTIIILAQSFSSSPSSKPTAWQERGFASVYRVASWLTDPICSAHRLYRQIFIVDAHYPMATELERWVRKSLLVFGSSAHALLSLITTFPGIALRFIVISLQNNPYIYFRGDGEEKQLMDKSFTLLSWNLCCVSGGYSITEGGVLPWIYRIHLLTSAVCSQNADVVCLFEIFDIQTALQLIEGLKSSYAHFYFNIGPSTIGLSSGMFVASKVKVANPAFVPFTQKSLDGRSKHCNKGVFAFDVLDEGKNVVRIFSTHLQHSEIPDNPTHGELKSRRDEMEIILIQIRENQDKSCVLTGDLNLEEWEYQASDWKECFAEGKIESQGCTWGGDQFCSALVGKPSSSPATLDHTMITTDTNATITTSYIETGFNAALFKPEALSDHKGLLSIIQFK